MPYIKQTRRNKIDSQLDALISAIKTLETTDVRDFDGDLNYSISRLLISVFELLDSPKYTKFNAAVGVLESVKLELYRRLIAPYEDKKIVENGDIF